ncbi:PorV/PorQ family protein [Ferruginibacter sp.]|nr:hypothetical protein [Ferruginibacter sp.]
MRFKILFPVTLIGIIAINNAMSQSIRYSVAMPYIGFGAYSTKQIDPLSFTANQAALANVSQAGVGLYGERRFLLAATSSYTVATVVPTKRGNFGVQLNYSGFKNFNENKLGLAYGRSLGPKIDVGIQFNYYSYRIPGYNGASSINFEAGAIMHFTEKLNGGIHVYNPVGGKLGTSATPGTSDEKLASAYKFGLGYDASENFFISSEIIKEEDKPVNVVAGVQYHFAKQFFARAGVVSESSTFFAGAGIGWKNLRLDVSGSYHPQLGFSPGVLLIAHFGNKKGG